MTALELLRRRLHHRGQTLLPALTVLLAAAALRLVSGGMAGMELILSVFLACSGAAVLYALIAQRRSGAFAPTALLMPVCFLVVQLIVTYRANARDSVLGHFYVELLLLAALCLAWFLLAILGTLCWTAGALRARGCFFLLLSLSAALPLLFVSPVGPRCLYASYLLTLAAAFSLLAESGLKPDFALPLCAGLCAAVLVFYTLSSLPLRRAVAAQETLLREAMLRGERTVRVPACGDTAGLLWEPNTPKMEYAYFYITPGDLSIEFETR